MSAKVRFVESIVVGELVLVCELARVGRVVGSAPCDPRFNADVLTVELRATSVEFGCRIEALRRALLPLPAGAERWGARFLPGLWSA